VFTRLLLQLHSIVNSISTASTDSYPAAAATASCCFDLPAVMLYLLCACIPWYTLCSAVQTFAICDQICLLNRDPIALRTVLIALAAALCAALRNEQEQQHNIARASNLTTME
jgi:hypothetical protein